MNGSALLRQADTLDCERSARGRRLPLLLIVSLR